MLPRRAAEREAAAAIRELRPWIERRVAELRRTRARVAARGATVPYLGDPLALVAEPGRTRVHRRGESLLVPGGGRTTGRRSSAGTGARRAPRSRRGSTPPPRRSARVTAA